jgi:KipI family sensor histidine kinase inhibitor
MMAPMQDGSLTAGAAGPSAAGGGAAAGGAGAPPALVAASDRSLLVRLGDRIASEVSARVLRLLRRLDGAALDGVVDLSPAYASILIRFDPLRTGHERLGAEVRELFAGLDDTPIPEPRLVSIPVVYGGEHGPDLAEVARFAGMTPEEVVALHCGAVYEVHFLGFSPGFAYLGTVPEAIACPRLDQPRRRVPAGSVGIAGTQTGVYPCATPGGWRLLGHTPLAMFDTRRAPMSLLEVGDRVRFVPIPPERFAKGAA